MAHQIPNGFFFCFTSLESIIFPLNTIRTIHSHIFIYVMSNLNLIFFFFFCKREIFKDYFMSNMLMGSHLNENFHLKSMNWTIWEIEIIFHYIRNSFHTISWIIFQPLMNDMCRYLRRSVDGFWIMLGLCKEIDRFTWCLAWCPYQFMGYTNNNDSNLL